MLPVHYVWLTWSALFCLVWLVSFLHYRNYRPLMWWSSILSLPFGSAVPFFLMNFWHPPSVLNLTQTVHADVETFLFCFDIGGTAAVGYHIVTGRPLIVPTRTAKDNRRLAWYGAAVFAPLPAFITALVLTRAIIWAGVAGFAAGVVARLLVRPDLTRKTLFGGLIFLAYYVVLLLVLTWLSPGYLELAWNMHGPAKLSVGPLPLTELLVGLGFGLYWNGLFEQLARLFPPLEK